MLLVIYIFINRRTRDMKAICITIPKKIKWEDYKKELKAVEDGSQVLNFKVPNLPKDIKNIRRCYLCYDGKIIGWHNIVGYAKDGDFECTTTGKRWEGNFIQRSGLFHYLKEPIECKAFRGFKYIEI